MAYIFYFNGYKFLPQELTDETMGTGSRPDGKGGLDITTCNYAALFQYITLACGCVHDMTFTHEYELQVAKEIYGGSVPWCLASILTHRRILLTHVCFWGNLASEIGWFELFLWSAWDKCEMFRNLLIPKWRWICPSVHTGAFEEGSLLQ